MDNVGFQSVSVESDAFRSGDLSVSIHSLFLGFWNLILFSIGFGEDLLSSYIELPDSFSFGREFKVPDPLQVVVLPGKDLELPSSISGGRL